MIDAHQHFWHPPDAVPAWLSATHRLHRRFEAEDLAALLPRAGVTATIAVQADDSLTDTFALLDRAARTPWIAGVVGWVDVRSGTADQLDRLAAHPAAGALVGIRISVRGPHAAGYRRDRSRVLDALAEVAARGLTLDVLADAASLPDVADIAHALPQLPIVLNHLAHPDSDNAGSWRTGLAELARFDNAYAKVSGLRTALPDPLARRAAVAHAVRLFRADRLLIGSDWPVSTLAGDYVATLAELVDLLGPDSPALGRTARTVYRLGADRTAQSLQAENRPIERTRP